jgi:hypothetical protein
VSLIASRLSWWLGFSACWVCLDGRLLFFTTSILNEQIKPASLPEWYWVIDARLVVADAGERSGARHYKVQVAAKAPFSQVKVPLFFQPRAANLDSRGSTTREGFNSSNRCVVSEMGICIRFLPLKWRARLLFFLIKVLCWV